MPKDINAGLRFKPWPLDRGTSEYTTLPWHLYPTPSVSFFMYFFKPCLQETTEQAYLKYFLTHHGLKLIWSWMVDLGDSPAELQMQVKIRDFNLTNVWKQVLLKLQHTLWRYRDIPCSFYQIEVTITGIVGTVGFCEPYSWSPKSGVLQYCCDSHDWPLNCYPIWHFFWQKCQRCLVIYYYYSYIALPFESIYIL